MKFAVFLYPGVEPIDLATFGVLSMARRIGPQIQMLTVAPEPGPVVLANGLTVLAQYGVDDCPPADALIITGGPGWPAQTANTVTLDFIRTRAKDSVVMSVCTGGMILAATGLLDGRHATTKREVVSPEEQPLALMHTRYPKVRRGRGTAGGRGAFDHCGRRVPLYRRDVAPAGTDAGRGGRLRNRAHPRIHDRPQR